MYEGHFNLTSDPFRLLPDPGICFPHRSCARAWSYLRYAVKRGEGIVVVLGPPGSGKTTLADRLLSELNPSKTVSARLIAHDLSPTDLLRKLAYAFGLPAEGIDRALLAHRIERYLFGLEQTNRRALVVIDEAQTLSNPALEAMRLLTDLQSRSRPVLQLILMGQPELETAMSVPEMEQFQHRVIASCRLLPMDLTETKAYLEYRLDRSGWQGNPTFDGPAVMAIYRHSGGLPRHVNKIGSRLLLHASSEDTHALTESDVQSVVRDLRGELIAPKNLGGPADQPPGESDASIYELALVPNARPSPSGRQMVRPLAGLYPKTEGNKPVAREPRTVPPVRPRVIEEAPMVDSSAVRRAAPPQRGISSAKTLLSNWRGAALRRLGGLSRWMWGAAQMALRALMGRLRALVADRAGLGIKGWQAALGGLVAVALVIAVWQGGAGDGPEGALEMTAEATPDRTELSAIEALAAPSAGPVPDNTNLKGPGFETALPAQSVGQLIAGDASGSLDLSNDLAPGELSSQITGVDRTPDQSLIGQVGDDVVYGLVGEVKEKTADLDLKPQLLPTREGKEPTRTERRSPAAAEPPGDMAVEVPAVDRVRDLSDSPDLLGVEAANAAVLLGDETPSTRGSSVAEQPTTVVGVSAPPLGQVADTTDWRSGTGPVAADLHADNLKIATTGTAGLQQGAASGSGDAGSDAAVSPTMSLAMESDMVAAERSQRDVLVMIEVERLAALADNAMARYRLLLPSKNSAYTYYQRILTLDPGNAKATAGLAGIVAKYREISSKALGDNDFEKAKLYVARALRVDPNDADALALRRTIDDAVADAEMARREAIELAAIKAEALRLSQMRQKPPARPKNELSNFERLMLSVEDRAQ